MNWWRTDEKHFEKETWKHEGKFSLLKIHLDTNLRHFFDFFFISSRMTAVLLIYFFKCLTW